MFRNVSLVYFCTTILIHSIVFRICDLENPKCALIRYAISDKYTNLANTIVKKTFRIYNIVSSIVNDANNMIS
eukprot:UN09568